MGVSVSSTPIVSQSALPHLHLTSVCRHPEQAPPSSQTIATTFSPHSPRQIRKQSPPEGAWADSGGSQPAVNPATGAHHHELSTPATHNGMRSAATAAVNGGQCTVREELCVVVAATAASHRPTSMLREHLSARRSRCQQRHNAPSHTGIVSVDSACTPTAASMCLGHSAPAGRRGQSAVRLHPATYLSAADHCGAQRSHRSARVATGHKSEGPVWRRRAPAPVHLSYQQRPEVARSPPSPTGAPPRTSSCFQRAGKSRYRSEPSPRGGRGAGL